MDFSGGETYNETDGRAEGSGRGCLGRLIRFFLAVCALVSLGAALFVYLLTTDLGRLWLLGRINRRIAPARLTVEGWDARFLGAATLTGVEYFSPDDGLRVTTGKLVLEKGLFALLPLGKLALGDLVLESPEVSLDLDRDSGRSVSQTDAGEDGKAFFLPVADVGGKLKVKNGRFVLRERDLAVFESGDIDGELIVESLWRPFGFRLKGRTGGGDVALTADLQSIISFAEGSDSSHGDRIVLQLTHVDIAALKGLAAAAGSPVVPCGGVVEGALTLERSGSGESFRVEGGLLADNLQVSSGGGRPSPAGNVALLIDAGLQGRECDIRKFEFSSPWGRAKISGLLRKVDDNRHLAGDVDADINLDVAAVTRDFRSWLGIDRELEFAKGRLACLLKLKEAHGEGVDVEALMKAEDVSMRYKGRPVVMTRAPSLRFKARLDGKRFPDVEELKFSSSFADIYGKGNIRQAVLKGYIDLTQFSTDFRGFIGDGTELGGAAHFNLMITPSGEGTEFDFMSKFSRIRVVPPGCGVTSVTDGSIALKGQVSGTSGAGSFSELEFNDIGYDLRIENSRVNGRIERFVPVQKDRTLPVMRGFTLSADLAVREIVGAFGMFMKTGTYTDAALWKGSLIANAAAESANDIAKARFNGAGRDIEFKTAGRVFKEPELRFGGGITINSTENSLHLNEVVVDSGALTVKVPEWTFRISSDGSAIGSGRADARMDVAMVYPFFAGNTGYDQIRGEISLGLNATGDEKGSLVRFNALLTDYYRLKDGEILFYEKRAELKGALSFKHGGKDAIVQSFNLYSSLADISAQGEIKDFRKNRDADLSGSIDLKFDSVEKLLRVRGIDEWRITGHKAVPFRLKGPLTSDFAGRGSFSGGAYLASLSGLGMKAGGAAIGVGLERGRLTGEWEPVLNGGRLRLSPAFDFSARGVTVSLKSDEPLLEDVAITQEMVDKLLVHFNPLFHGSRIHSGTISMKMNSFLSGPEKGHGDLVADADCSLENLEMSLSPAMRDLLGLIHVKDKIYRVRHLPIHVTVRNERVFVDPVTMVFSGQPVSFSGSVGFNSTISYLVEVPLGEAIARKTGLKLPGGLTVKVPVTGTVDNPRLDTSALEKTLGGFIRNTLGDDALRNVTDFLNQLKKEIR